MSFLAPLVPRQGELYAHTAIRGVAALCVVGYHAMLGSAGKGYTDNPVQNYFLTSFIFVDFFFILSGFIMFENYGKKLSGPSVLKNAINFWKRRALKILPNYYFWLAIAVLLTFAEWAYFSRRVVDNQCIEFSLIKHVFLTQNLMGSCYYFNIPLWSIAVEMLAYLVFPFIILLRLGRALTFLGSVVLYVVLFSYSETIDVLDGALSVCRCLAGFFCGVAAAQLPHKKWASFLQVILLLLLVATISMNFQVLSLALMLMITVATSKNEGVLATLSATRFPYLIGRSSFSIYLAHIPVAAVVSTIAYKIEGETGVPFGSDWRLIVPIEILASVMVGYMAFELIERRFERLVNRRNVMAQAP